MRQKHGGSLFKPRESPQMMADSKEQSRERWVCRLKKFLQSCQRILKPKSAITRVPVSPGTGYLGIPAGPNHG